MFHDLEQPGSIHPIHNWEYDDATAREAATGFAVTDLKKVALQLDDLTYWTLVDVAGGPSAWSPFDKGGTPFNADTPADELEAALHAADAGSTDAYAITLAPAISSYIPGTAYRFKANTANTGAATLNINGLGAQAIKKAAGGVTTDLATNDIRAGQWVDVVWDGTNFQMQSTLGNAASGFSASTNANDLDAAFHAADAGSTDAYAITLSPAIPGYVTGAHIVFMANTANTGAATLDVNGLGAKTIKKAAGGVTTDLATNDIRAGQWVHVVYDGTNFQMLSLLGNAPSSSAPTTATTTSTGNQDDFNFSNADVLYCNNASALTLRGLVAGVDGQKLLIVVLGSASVTLKHQNTNSSANNRMILTDAFDIVIGSPGQIQLVYDGANSRWRSATPPGARLTTQLVMATGQSFADATFVSCQFTSATSNNYGVWSAGTPTRLTVPTGKGGTYQFVAGVSVGNATTGNQRQAIAKVNGTTFLNPHISAVIPGGNFTQFSYITVVQLADGDYLELFLYQDSGGARTDVSVNFAAFTRIGD